MGSLAGVTTNDAIFPMPGQNFSDNDEDDAQPTLDNEVTPRAENETPERKLKPHPMTVNTDEPVDTTTEEFKTIDAALYDSALVVLPICLPTVANTIPTLDPAPMPEGTLPIIELSLLQTLLSEAVEEVEPDAIEKRRLPLKLENPKPLPKTVNGMLPLATTLLGLIKLKLAALYDNDITLLISCVKTVATTNLISNPVPTPDPTRPLNELSLVQMLFSEAVEVNELDATQNRRRPLTPTAPYALPNAMIDLLPLIAALNGLVEFRLAVL